jgi:hypothetical protein
MNAVRKQRALHAVEGGRKTFRSVEVAQRQENDSWSLADAIFEDLADIRPDLTDIDASRSHGVNTGLTEAEGQIADAMSQAGLDYAQTYIHQMYVTSRAWSAEDRVEAASFKAHYLLRSQTYDKNRKAILDRLAKKSRTGRVTGHAVEVYISERKPRHSWTFLALVDRRVRASLKAAAQPWHLVADTDRESIADLLRAIAAEVEDGTFPKKART